MGTYTSSLKNDKNFFWSPFSHSQGCLLSPISTTRSLGARSFISLVMSFRMRAPGSLKPMAFTFFLSLSHVSSASSNFMIDGASALATLNTMCIIIAAFFFSYLPSVFLQPSSNTFAPHSAASASMSMLFPPCCGPYSRSV